MDPIEHNRRMWDERARRGARFARPIDYAELDNMTTAVDPWVADRVAGAAVLCLAAGGGRQGPVYARAGGHVTVIDVSNEQLDHDRRIAAELGLAITTLRASMDDLSALAAERFDVVVQPVSTCYVPCVAKVYAEVARVTKPGGVYVSQHKQPTSMQADVRRSPRGYEITERYYRNVPLPEVTGSPHREPGTIEYLHRWEQLVGELCRAGFVVEDLAEPDHSDRAGRPGSFGDRSLYVPPYVRIKARRTGRDREKRPAPRIIV